MKKGFFYFVPILFNEETYEIKGRNWLFDIALNVLIFIHIVFVIRITGIEDFPIRIMRDE